MSFPAFATLTPENALTKLDFSDLYEFLLSRRRNALRSEIAALHPISVQPQQIFDRQVFQIQRESNDTFSATVDENDTDTTESLPELDSDIEKLFPELGLIWTGEYRFTFERVPSFIPSMGFTVGKGPLEDVPVDLTLCTKSFAKSYDIKLRNPHARFNFSSENRGFYVAGCSRSQLAQVTVNGDTAHRRPYHLNQHRMNIRLDRLAYVFKWTEYAATDTFKEDREGYMITALGAAAVDIEMPTPCPSNRTMGKWTLGDALGAGGCGRVFFASNSLGDVAALKIMERTTQDYHAIDAEVQRCKEVTAFAIQSDPDRRILRLIDVIYTNEEKFSPTASFDNVAMVMQPMTPHTLQEWVGIRSKGGSKGMTMKAAAVFRDALKALKVMHDGNWLHRDLKPANICVFKTRTRSILLDVGTAAQIEPGGVLRSEPGCFGTIGYLAPELELDDYDHSIDIWAMGIILYQLTYGHHPWKFAINPWCNEEDNRKVRQAFEKRYVKAVEQMMEDDDDACQSPTAEYLHLGGLFVEMVRHRWSTTNHGQRLTIDEVLQHPAWGPLLPESSPNKKRRKEIGLDDKV